jgi:hypothetical protein
MPPELATPASFPGQAYALVIGISNYQNGCKAGQERTPEQFNNLKCAAQDAKDFAEFLEDNGFIKYNVQRLIDEQAEATRIKHEFEELRKRCQQSADPDPLVIVFFAGHGMADKENRHYLIPWEAQRNELFSTALLNKHFSDCLGLLKTNKLVVFIDACDAGAIGLEDARGELPPYTPKELGEGRGRYVIGSCAEGQRSWEGEKNGIFTGHLLELLRCKGDDLDEEEIDIFHLFPVLKEKVAKTANERYQQKQEPTINDMKAATGIILAVNQKVRDQRIQKQRQDLEIRYGFCDVTCESIKKSGYDKKTLMGDQLRDYVGDQKSKWENFGHFYQLFEELLQLYRDQWRGRTDWPVVNVCNQLINAHKRALAEPPPAATPGRTEIPARETPVAAAVAVTSGEELPAQEPSKPADRPEGGAQTSILGVERPVVVEPMNSSAGRQRQFKQLSEDDIVDVLRELMRLPKYFTETRDLKRCLAKPVTEGEFARTVHSLADKRPDDGSFENILKDVLARFEPCWNNAKVVELQNVASLMIERR